MKSLPLLLTATLLALALGCTSDPCVDVVERVAHASEGSGVLVQGCHLTTPLVVPAGVTVLGSNGASVTVDDTVAVELLTGTGHATRIEGLLIESGGPAAIAVRGSGLAEVASVVVHAAAGVAIGTDGAQLTITGGELSGEVTAENRDDSRWLRVISSPPAPGTCPTDACECEPGTVEETRACDTTGRWATVTATHGVFARGGGVAITGTHITGFALAGIELHDANAIIEGVHVDSTLGVGIESVGGALSATGTTIAEVWTGLRGAPSYAALFAMGASINTAMLDVHDVDGYGLVHSSSRGVHRSLSIARAGDVSLWCGATDLVEVLGGHVEGGAFASVLAVDVASVHLSDVQIEGTRAVRRAVGLRGAIDVGDGVELVGSTPQFERVSITGSERAGLVAELDAPIGGAFVDVTVTTEGTGLGAIAGTLDGVGGTISGDAAAGWDDGITRAGTAAANDAAFIGSLDAVVAAEPPSAASLLGAIGPMY